MNQRLRHCVLLTLTAALLLGGESRVLAADTPRPNILFAMADDWGWPHAGAYGDPVVKTPTFDRLARDGALFENVFVSAPSCTPSRGAILTGQWHWRLKGAANLWSVFPDEFTTYPELLAKAGYETAVTGKGWGPGKVATPGRQIVGKRFRNFQAFMDQRDRDKPFCFWLGTSDPHRPYKAGSGKASGMDLDKIKPFGCFPDVPEVRSDIADYYWEVQRWDALVGKAVETLKKTGQLNNTIILMTGDHNMPFPRCKGNLYDCGSRVPLAICWPAQMPGHRVIDDFVSFTDFAPTFLAAAGLPIPSDVTGRSLLSILKSDRSGQIDPRRVFTLIGKERHCPGQEAPSMGGYPCRALRTKDFLYVRNFDPQRWPAGTPNWKKATYPGSWLGDCDNGPTKTYMVENRHKDAQHEKLYDLAFGRRPAEELYDMRNDPDQLDNVIDQKAYADIRKKLATQLLQQLQETGDPRVVGGGEQFDKYPYLGGSPQHPGFAKEKKTKKK